MKTFTCNKFTGHYPVGVAAVVRAQDTLEAAQKLNEALRQQGLPGDANPQDMLEFGGREQVRILADGDY